MEKNTVSSSIMRGADKLNRANARAAKNIGRAANRATDKVVEKEQEFVDAAHNQLKKAHRQWDNADRAINEYVKENPKKAVAIAAGVGAAVGVAATALVRRKR